MPEISDEQLTYMRAQVFETLPEDGTIQEISSTTPDGKGGRTENWTTVTGGAIKCRVDPSKRSKSRDQIAGRRVLEVEYLITMPHDAPAAANRRIVIGSSTYKFTDVDGIEHSKNVSKRMYAEKIVPT